MIPINYLAVFVAALISMVLGFLWYGPIFGKPWIALMKFTQEDIEKAKQKGMTKEYLLMMVSALVMAFVLAHNVLFGGVYLEMTGWAAGVQAGIWNWLGFVVPITLSGVLWEGKPWKLWMLNAGYYLVSLVVMGIILASW